MKLNSNIMPLEAILSLFFVIPNYLIVPMCISEVGATLALRSVGFQILYDDNPQKHVQLLLGYLFQNIKQYDCRAYSMFNF
jgi:hypothetical protein